MELRGMKFMDGMIVQVGKATQERDHGAPMWMCQTTRPLKPVFHPVLYRHEAIAWLQKECGAEEVIEASVVEE